MTQVKTPTFRGSYMNKLIEGEEKQNNEGKPYMAYSLRADFEPEDCPGFDAGDPRTYPNWAKEAIEEAIETGKTKFWKGKRPNNLSMPFMDGDDADKPELEGKVYCNMKAFGRRCPVLGMDNKAISPDGGGLNEQVIYSGAYYKAVITFAPYDAQGNRGVSARLVAVRKVDDGERMAGGISESQAEDMFGDEDGTQAAVEDDFLS
ncbi:ssDNA-binding protein [Kushneria phosphatilytica]|uniref:DUF2815 family protein n=1 Tax=Kushneria phosphatilytica TaxID=657387 RepID=A0A1S1NSA4_9GAMM|nr:ssDNA-binding protein [Kushneria phosphatilytica]OHV12144.1 hypothetical protein BH688_05685 [Kushneria phosphatilytica]QEL11336.1 DUF2815 family protein [Kushneria phosphatilytica]